MVVVVLVEVETLVEEEVVKLVEVLLVVELVEELVESETEVVELDVLVVVLVVLVEVVGSGMEPPGKKKGATSQRDVPYRRSIQELTIKLLAPLLYQIFQLLAKGLFCSNQKL